MSTVVIFALSEKIIKINMLYIVLRSIQKIFAFTFTCDVVSKFLWEKLQGYTYTLYFLAVQAELETSHTPVTFETFVQGDEKT